MTDLQDLRSDLRARFVDRDTLIDLALIALVSGEHLLMVGPPGTAKSMLASELCSRLSGGEYFSWLLTRFSTPEELFGPVSLQSLENDVYRRVTHDKLPTADIAFIDEIFKANSAILNSLLSVMNERIFHDGEKAVSVPLISLFAASNELPDEDELVALYDRFLLRYAVGYIDDDSDFMRMLTARHTPSDLVFTLADLNTWRAEAAALPIPEPALADLVAIRRELAARDLVASDRRYRQSLSALRASAYLNGRTEVGSADLAVLEHVLWDDPETHGEVREVVEGVVERFMRDAEAIASEADGVFAASQRRFSLPSEALAAQMEALAKLTTLRNDIYALCEEAAAAHRLDDEVTTHRDRVEALLGRVLESVERPNH